MDQKSAEEIQRQITLGQHEVKYELSLIHGEINRIYYCMIVNIIGLIAIFYVLHKT